MPNLDELYSPLPEETAADYDTFEPYIEGEEYAGLGEIVAQFFKIFGRKPTARELADAATRWPPKVARPSAPAIGGTVKPAPGAEYLNDNPFNRKLTPEEMAEKAEAAKTAKMPDPSASVPLKPYVSKAEKEAQAAAKQAEEDAIPLRPYKKRFGESQGD